MTEPVIAEAFFIQIGFDIPVWLAALFPAAGFLLGYIVGGIPFGLIAGKVFKGVDLREHGSRNIGGTNAIRVLGKEIGISCLILDVMKGFLPVLLVNSLLAGGDGAQLAMVVCAAGAILGHVFPIYLLFKGGKGVATGLGTLLVMAPVATAAGLAMFLVVFAVFRYVSLASMTAAVLFPLFFVAGGLLLGEDPFGKGLPVLIFAVVVAVMIVFRHRSNIGRILAGTENRFGGKKLDLPGSKGE